MTLRDGDRRAPATESHADFIWRFEWMVSSRVARCQVSQTALFSNAQMPCKQILSRASWCRMGPCAYHDCTIEDWIVFLLPMLGMAVAVARQLTNLTTNHTDRPACEIISSRLLHVRRSVWCLIVSVCYIKSSSKIPLSIFWLIAGYICAGMAILHLLLFLGRPAPIRALDNHRPAKYILARTSRVRWSKRLLVLKTFIVSWIWIFTWSLACCK